MPVVNRKKKAAQSNLRLQDTPLTPDTIRDPTMGDVLKLEAPGPQDPMTKLYANRYTNEDSMLWQQ